MRLPDHDAACWINGRAGRLDQARLALDDPAVQAAVGLFETLAVRAGRALDLDAHLERLSRSAERMRLPLPDAATLHAVVAEAAAAIPDGLGWVKIIVSGAGEWFVYGGTLDPDEEGRACSAVLLPWRRNPRDPLAGLKTLNYAANRFGLEEARRRGADEGIWLNTRGHLAEGCQSNLFVVRGRKLFTAGEREGILPGVIRQLVLDSAREMGVAIHEGRLRLVRLERADEAFLSSSVRGIRPLVRFDGRPVGRGEPGPLTRHISRAVARRRAGLTVGP